MKIISGGQNGGDLGGNAYALKHGIETEIFTHFGFKPIYPSETFDKVKVTHVSTRNGVQGLVTRRRFNIKNSDLAIVLCDGEFPSGNGSLATIKECIEYGKDYLVLSVSTNVNDFFAIDFLSKLKTPGVINIAGERKLNEEDVVSALERVLWVWIPKE